MLEYQPIATEQDMREGPYRYALQGASQPFIDSTMLRSSRRVESICGRKFVPFEGAVQTEIAEGVAQGSDGGGLGYPDPNRLSLSNALIAGSGGMVRDFWIDDHATENTTDLWTYSDVSVHITPPYGGAGADVGAVIGPAHDTGHLQLPLGVYCPVGSIVAMRYGGGFTVAYPDDLVQAALMVACKFFILALAPEQRSGLTTKGLDEEIIATLVPFGAPDPRRQIRRGGR